MYRNYFGILNYKALRIDVNSLFYNLFLCTGYCKFVLTIGTCSGLFNVVLTYFNVESLSHNIY